MPFSSHAIFVICHFHIRPLPPYPEAPAQQNGGPVTVNVFSVFSFYHHIQEWRVMLLCLKWHLMGKEPLGDLMFINHFSLAQGQIPEQTLLRSKGIYCN